MAENSIQESTATTTTASKIGTYPSASTACIYSSKPDIKVSSDGVAKLNFSFLDEFQGGDSSLEPGEVITPPHSISPVPAPSSSSKTSAAAAAAIKTPSKLTDVRSNSQTEAQVCEEKVRAILELDAIKRREELEKRKQDLEKRRQSGELEREEEEKRKAKAERKRIKKIEREQRAARLALMSDDTDVHRGTDDKIKQTKKFTRSTSEDRESGERCSSSEEEKDDGDDSPKQLEGNLDKCSASADVNSVAAVLTSSSPVYHPTLPPPFPDPTYGNPGFHPMAMFPRNIRPDYHHSRGCYIPRGRGGRISNNMRFPLYRAPFYGANTGGSMQMRAHGPAHSRRLSSSSRGHSPLQHPSSGDVKWTKAQPSLTYSLKWESECKPSTSSSSLLSKGKKNDELSCTSIAHTKKTKSGEKTEKKSKSSKSSKSHVSNSSKKSSKKTKKSKSRNKNKRKSSKSSEKSSLRKIAKIRKTFENRKISKTEEEQKESLAVKDKEYSSNIVSSNETKKKEENLITNENLQMINTDYNNENAMMVDAISDKKIDSENSKSDNRTTGETFDIFAVTPPPQPSPSRNLKAVVKTECKDRSKEQQVKPESRSCTPPLELLHLPLKQPIEKTPIQKAREMQQRIGKLLQDDDLQLETLEATKEKLLQTTQKMSSQPIITTTTVAATTATTTVTANVDKGRELKSVTKRHEKGKEKEEKVGNNAKDDHRSNHGKSDQKTNGSSSSSSKYSNPFRRSTSRSAESKRRRSNSDRNSSPPRKQAESKRSKSRPESPPSQRQRSGTRELLHLPSKSKTLYRSKNRGEKPQSPPPKHSSSSLRDTRHISSSRDQRTRPEEYTKKYESREYHKANSRVVSSGSGSGSQSTTKKRRLSWEHGKKHEDINLKRSKPNKNAPLSFNASEFLSTDLDDENTYEVRTPRTTDDKKKSKNSADTTTNRPSVLLRNDEYNDNNEEDADDDDTTASSILPNVKKSGNTNTNKDSSPDTDDYMDNWEVDDPDSSNTAAETSIIKNEIMEDNTDDLLARYKNPSPQFSPSSSSQAPAPATAPAPARLPQCQPKSLHDSSALKRSLTPPLPLQNKNLTPIAARKDEGSAVTVGTTITSATLSESKEESSLQEDIHGQKAIDIDTSAALNKNKPSPEKVSHSLKRAEKRNLSTSSSSSSSSSSSNSSSTTSTSGSSDSSGSTSASAKSDETDVGKNVAFNNVKIKQEPIFIKQEYDEHFKGGSEEMHKSCSAREQPQLSPIVKHAVAENQSLKPALNFVPHSSRHEISEADEFEVFSSTDPVKVLEVVLPPFPTETQKVQIGKDLKRVKSYEANLKRTQSMRSNFDASDDIFSELAKMEKLFLHAIKFIIQKYTNGREVYLQTESDGNIVKPKFVLDVIKKKSTPLPKEVVVTTDNSKSNRGLNHPKAHESTADMATTSARAPVTSVAPSVEEQSTSAATESVNIFDSNRETIKLTIAPLKLTKKSAIFDKLDKTLDNGARSRSSSVAGGDDVDFTETLVKTTKEIAIVKPMSKDPRSASPRHSSSSRRLSPKVVRQHMPPRNSSRGKRSSSRSGSAAYPNNENRSRRSNSASRHGFKRRGRPRTLSVSPQPRDSHSRHDSSPKRRGGGGKLSPNRYRRSRSPLRRPPLKRGDLSPFRKRRQGPVGGNASESRSGGRFNEMRSYSRSPSRSRSPTAYHNRFGGRHNFARNSTPSGHRRSFSRDRYSRSPLPFKPPSPPMRHSPEHDGETKRSCSRRRSRSQSRSSRSYSHSPSSPPRKRSHSPRSPQSPRSKRSPRSPRSPQPPHSPRSPQSPRSPRPHTPPPHYVSSYEMYRPNSSSQQQHVYFAVQHGMHGSSPHPTSDYYYESSPNMGLNGQDNGSGQRGQLVYTNAYDTTNQYNQYQGASPAGYLPHGMQSGHAIGMEMSGGGGGGGNEYYENNFMGQSIYNTGMPSHSSNMQHYFNDQVPVHIQSQEAQQILHTTGSASLLKELPKATIAVQKGNVLEIVPNELSTHSQFATVGAAAPIKSETNVCNESIISKPTKPTKQSDPVKEEIIKRLEISAKLKESRKSSNGSGDTALLKTSILKKCTAQPKVLEDTANQTATPQFIAVKDEPAVMSSVKRKRKKVLFEDGLFPNRDSDDEDSKDAIKSLRRDIRQMRKLGRKAATVLCLLSSRKPGTKQKPSMPALSKMQPPPPPPHHPVPHSEQPVPNRPPTPPRFVFYHYDAVVHALYTSPSEHGIPPRLTDPKAAAAFAHSKCAGIAGGAIIKKRGSPIFTIKRDPSTNAHTVKHIGSSQNSTAHSVGRGSASPQMTQAHFYNSRRGGNVSFNKNQTTQYHHQQQQQQQQQQHQQSFNSAPHQRYGGNSETSLSMSSISTLSTQPLSQPQPQPRATQMPIGAAATFQSIKPNSPQMPASPAPGQMLQIQQTSLGHQFSSSVDVRSIPQQQPQQQPVFPLPPHPHGSIAHHPRGGFQQPSIYFMYPPGMQQQHQHQIIVNGAPTTTSSINQIQQQQQQQQSQQQQPQHSQPQSYAYHPYVPNSPIRPATTQKNAIITHQPRAAAQHFNVFP